MAEGFRFFFSFFSLLLLENDRPDLPAGRTGVEFYSRSYKKDP